MDETFASSTDVATITIEASDAEFIHDSEPSSSVEFSNTAYSPDFHPSASLEIPELAAEFEATSSTAPLGPVHPGEVFTPPKPHSSLFNWKTNIFFCCLTSCIVMSCLLLIIILSVLFGLTKSSSSTYDLYPMQSKIVHYHTLSVGKLEIKPSSELVSSFLLNGGSSPSLSRRMKAEHHQECEIEPNDDYVYYLYMNNGSSVEITYFMLFSVDFYILHSSVDWQLFQEGKYSQIQFDFKLDRPSPYHTMSFIPLHSDVYYFIVKNREPMFTTEGSLDMSFDLLTYDTSKHIAGSLHGAGDFHLSVWKHHTRSVLFSAPNSTDIQLVFSVEAISHRSWVLSFIFSILIVGLCVPVCCSTLTYPPIWVLALVLHLWRKRVAMKVTSGEVHSLLSSMTTSYPSRNEENGSGGGGGDEDEDVSAGKLPPMRKRLTYRSFLSKFSSMSPSTVGGRFGGGHSRTNSSIDAVINGGSSGNSVGPVPDTNENIEIVGDDSMMGEKKKKWLRRDEGGDNGDSDSADEDEDGGELGDVVSPPPSPKFSPTPRTSRGHSRKSSSSLRGFFSSSFRFRSWNPARSHPVNFENSNEDRDSNIGGAPPTNGEAMGVTNTPASSSHHSGKNENLFDPDTLPVLDLGAGNDGSTTSSRKFGAGVFSKTLVDEDAMRNLEGDSEIMNSYEESMLIPGAGQSVGILDDVWIDVNASESVSAVTAVSNALQGGIVKSAGKKGKHRRSQQQQQQQQQIQQHGGMAKIEEKKLVDEDYDDDEEFRYD